MNKILIVEDDKDIRELIHLSLSSQNISNIYSARNLPEAKSLLLSDNFQILLLDLNLENENGYQLLKYIDHNEINPDIHIELNDVHDGISLSYEDNGVGIDRNELDYLMTSGGTTKERDEHHGIGFSVIQDAIIFHSGNLTILPTNQGVKFLITLR